MLSVDEALARVLAAVAPVGAERAPLDQAAGRVLAEPVRAARDQPPFACSAMDGWALRAAEAPAGAMLKIVGEAHAGKRFSGVLPPRAATRIFTGAPMPEGADAVLIQENAAREGDRLRVGAELWPGLHVRARGADFERGAAFAPPRRLTPADVALVAAMGCAQPVLRRRPRIVVLPTGDELVEPGAAPGPDQIFASNHLGVAALARAAGAQARLRPIVADAAGALIRALRDAAGEADLIVTLGGASVGERDFLRDALGGDAVQFHKVAMRPGKPLTLGRVDTTPLLGLPGNPVSAMLCAELFLKPAIAAMLGLPARAAPRRPGRLVGDLPPNGARAHFMRATRQHRRDAVFLTPADSQDSALLTRLAAADALILRAPHAPAARDGDDLAYISLREGLDEQS